MINFGPCHFIIKKDVKRNIKGISYLSGRLILLRCFIEDTHEASPGEFENETVIGDNGTYYNTTELSIAIRVDDLQCVISEKSIGENKAFLSEFKVIGNNRLQRTTDMYKYALQRKV